MSLCKQILFRNATERIQCSKLSYAKNAFAED